MSDIFRVTTFSQSKRHTEFYFESNHIFTILAITIMFSGVLKVKTGFKWVQKDFLRREIKILNIYRNEKGKNKLLKINYFELDCINFMSIKFHKQIGFKNWKIYKKFNDKNVVPY